MRYPHCLRLTILAIAFLGFGAIIYYYNYISTEFKENYATNSIASSGKDYNFDSSLHINSLKSLDIIMNQTNQVFMTMPTKAAGTTINTFTRYCMDHLNMTGNFMNFQEQIEKIFIDNYQAPSIISSHLRSDGPFIGIVKGATRETLVIYLHREELSRVRSATQHVLMSKICTYIARGKKLMDKYHFDVEVNSTRCTIDEEHIITIIKNRDAEIGFGAPEILTCDYFDAIAQNTPYNLVFIHYSQANKLQRILAKHYCPHAMKDLPIAKNVAIKKKMELFVRLQTNRSRTVSFEDWFDTKQNLIFWALNSNSKMNCKSKIIDMEDHLFSCPDEAVILFQDKFQCVSLAE